MCFFVFLIISCYFFDFLVFLSILCNCLCISWYLCVFVGISCISYYFLVFLNTYLYLYFKKCKYIHVFVNFKPAGTCAWVVVLVSLSQVCPRSIPRSIPKVYPEVYQKHAAMIKALRGPFYDICFIFDIFHIS